MFEIVPNSHVIFIHTNNIKNLTKSSNTSTLILLHNCMKKKGESVRLPTTQLII